jgi:hypothetical protein
MRKFDIDKILHTQLIIARMGEKELMNWWNTDIAYKMGGADFLKRLRRYPCAPFSRRRHFKEQFRGQFIQLFLKRKAAGYIVMCGPVVLWVKTLLWKIPSRFWVASYVRKSMGRRRSGWQLSILSPEFPLSILSPEFPVKKKEHMQDT